VEIKGFGQTDKQLTSDLINLELRTKRYKIKKYKWIVAIDHGKAY
jgi:hypothetical protein